MSLRFKALDLKGQLYGLKEEFKQRDAEEEKNHAKIEKMNDEELEENEDKAWFTSQSLSAIRQMRRILYNHDY